MSGEGLDGGGRGEIPDADSAIIGGGAEIAAVRGERYVGDALVVSGELRSEGEVGGGPHADGFVSRGGGEE